MGTILPTKRRAYFQMHVAVFLFGFTAILGEWISLTHFVLVWWRLFFTCASLLFFPRVWRQLRILSRRQWMQLAGIGTLVTLHWIFFYAAIKASNVSITLCCIATTAFFTAFVEPLIFRQRIKGYEVGLGLLIIPGMALVVHFVQAEYYMGIVYGLIAALLAAIFPTLNKKVVSEIDSMSVTFVELASGLLLLSIWIPLYQWNVGEVQFWPEGSDWVELLVLALLCTTLAYALSLNALRVLSAFVSTLSVNLEPIYGTLMAIWFFGEHEALSNGFFVGLGIILLSVFSHPLIEHYLQRRRARLQG